MREVNSIRSVTSIFLVFSLLVPLMNGELNTYALSGSHNKLIVKKLDTPVRQDTRIPYELTGKEEENRSEKSTHDSFAYTVSESFHYAIYQQSDSFVDSLPRSKGPAHKVALYLQQRSLLI